MTTRQSWFWLVAVVALCKCFLGTPAVEARQRLVVVSIDGLYPEAYLESAALGLEVPNLLRLAKGGVAAEAMIGVFPSTTYPTHATLITGVRPAKHGVTANAFFNPARGSKDMYWFTSGLRVPTLPEVAHAAGLKVASVQWPCLADADYVDLRIAEIWSVEPSTTTRELHHRFATPGLIDRVEERFGEWTHERFKWGHQDGRIVDAACAIIEADKPDAIWVHIIELDHVLHEWGRGSPEAHAAIAAADRHLGRILEALAAAGQAASTNVVVLSDHGFASVHSELRPNVILAELGLVTVPGDGVHVEDWKALFHTSAAGGALYLNEATDAASRDAALRRFRALADGRYSGLFRLLERRELDQLGAFPGAEFGIVAQVGYQLSNKLTGDFLSATHDRGQHGYLPDMPEMHAAFIASGPDFRSGVRVPRLRMVDVAPTLAHVLDVELGDQVEGVVVPGLLAEAERAAQ